MHKAILAVSLVASLAACTGTSVRVGAGYDANQDHIGQNPVGVLMVDQKLTDNMSCGWLHVSNILDGVPFNQHEENVADIGYCMYNYTFK